MNNERDVERLCELLKTASAASAYEAIGKSGDLEPSIRAMVADVLCVGVAYTVRSPSFYGDEIAKAADEAPAGSVLVIDVGSDVAACGWGGTGTVAAQLRGIAGCVTSGYVRDIAEIRQARFPVFARGSTVRGWRKSLHGQTGIPVAVGGQAIFPGDLICADDDGVVVIAQSHFDALEASLRARLEFDEQAARLAREGTPYTQIIARKPG